ncbi:hypothetical protein RIF29_08400 [Crotalaria pallida]|uniref:Uncharacterized protein n=1 Tax=Crotalaria pallida TaxID=3830 RepID=A0AAN9FQT8_CROPI
MLGLSVQITSSSGAPQTLARLISLATISSTSQQCITFPKTLKFLEQLVILGCDFITQVGNACAIKWRPNLTSLGNDCSVQVISSVSIASLVSLKSLTCIDFSFMGVPDELLFSIEEAGLPLRKLVLQSCGECWTLLLTVKMSTSPMLGS